MLHCPTCGKQYPADVRFCPADQTSLQADATIQGSVPPDPLLGRTLDDKYRIEERLGVGGMGTVYRARHILIDRLVALKVLNQRFVEDEAARIRFQREARAAGRLQHMNAVSVTDFGQTAEGYVYIVMELLEGRTLREIVAKEAPLETARAVSIMLQVSAAVGAAHDAGVIHRDLKPANIFVTQRSDLPAIVKVLDFGIAKLAADTLEEDDVENLTQVGAMIGTPRYMSPEQCNGLELTPASDVYSLGVILYEMLTGMAPFTGSSPLAIAVKHASEPPRSPREIVSSIPENLEQLILNALEKRPENRPANATAFRNQLLETAEKLGLEHAATTSAPNLKSLRDFGTESPSGRLIIDLSKLRESGAFSSTGDETVIAEKAAPAKQSEAVAHGITRFNFPVKERHVGRNILLAALAIVILLLGGYAAFLTRRAVTGAQPSLTATPSPTPTATATPTPSPSPSPSVSPSPRHSPTPEKKKESKVGSFVNKVKRILKKPF